MGRKRNREVVSKEEKREEVTSKKKPKKVKHKKHRSIKSEDETPVIVTKPITLKIRLGNEVLTADSSDHMSLCGDDSIIESNASGKSAGLQQTQPSDEWMGGDDISVEDDHHIPEEEEELENEEEEEDEEAWLDALETGNVDERGYIPQKKDPTSMTARQRAILGSKEVELLELPLMKKRGVVEEEETQDMLLKKTERNRKRRLQAIKRREKHKAETVQKLLQKQTRKKEDKKVSRSVTGPHLRYINSVVSGITVSITDGLEYPLLVTKTPLVIPPVVKCTICSNQKKYNDSVTNLPLCSLDCYNKLSHH